MNWSVGRKLVVGEAILLLALLCTLTLYVATYCGKLLEENYVSDMKRQVVLAKGLVEAYDHTILQSTERFSAILRSYFPQEFTVDSGRTVLVGGVETPLLLHGGTVLNNNFATIDSFSKMTATVGTIFVRSGDDFVHVTTSLRTGNGSRALGTTIGKDHPGYKLLIRGESYLGHSKLLGRDYSTKYTPIRDASGTVVAVLFVGVDTTEAMNFIKEQIKKIRIGKSGYIYVLDAAEGKDQGLLLIHPYEEGKNILAVRSTDGREVTREMINSREGITRYSWMNKERYTRPRVKTVVYSYYDKRDLVVAAGSYEDEVIAQAVKLRYILLLASILFIVIMVGVLHLATQHLVVKPLKEAVKFAGVVAGGDLTTSVRGQSGDEIGRLVEALNRMVVGLRQMVVRIRDTSAQVASTANDISTNSAHLARAAHSQSSATEETTSTMTEMAASIQSVAAHAESLAGSAVTAFSSIEELGASGEEVAKNAETMASSVAEVSSTIEQMTRSISRMSGNNDELQKVVNHSAATIEELAFSIREAAKTVAEADAVAKSAAAEAGAGEKAIQEALAGMTRIGEVIEKTAAALSNLGRRSEEIGSIVKVISGIAEHSNLLALNASILAVQAGDAGLGFAVVAEEMRTLACQSAEATNKISKVIGEVQADTASSVQYGELAAREAQASMALSSTAGSSLANIVKNIEQTTALMSNIARMTAEQADASNQVIMAVEKMSRASEVVANTAEEQSAASSQIRSSAQLMNNLTQVVTMATREQSVAARHITHTVHAISDMTQQVANVTAEQKTGVQVVVAAVDNIGGLTLQNLASIEQLSQATRGLSQQAIGLAGLIEQFKVR